MCSKNLTNYAFVVMGSVTTYVQNLIEVFPQLHQKEATKVVFPWWHRSKLTDHSWRSSANALLTLLTLFFPRFPFDSPENIRKPLAF